MHCQEIVEKGAKTPQWAKDSLSTNGTGKTGYPHQKNEVRLTLHHRQRLTQKRI